MESETCAQQADVRVNTNTSASCNARNCQNRTKEPRSRQGWLVGCRRGDRGSDFTKQYLGTGKKKAGTGGVWEKPAKEDQGGWRSQASVENPSRIRSRIDTGNGLQAGLRLEKPPERRKSNVKMAEKMPGVGRNARKGDA
jgi:hypothetical protein